MSDAPILEEGTITIELQERDADQPVKRFRARVDGSDYWWSSDTAREALSGAVSIALEDGIADALGELWEGST